LVVFMVALPGQSMAENNAGSMGLTFFFGGYTFDPDQDLDSELTVGLGLGYNITSNLGIEAMVNTVDTKGDFGFDASALVSHVDGLYHFNPEKKLVLYLAAGVGLIRIDYDSFLHSNDTDMLVNYGAGLKYFVDKSVALRADVRHIISFGPTNNNLRYTLGLLFPFGGKSQLSQKSGQTAVLPESDSDGDGVPDHLDKCPDTHKGVAVDRYGCPRTQPTGAEVTERGTYVFRNIQFDTGKATIKQGSYAVLDNVVMFLRDNPDMNMEIQGHTDNIGSEAFNVTLSESRAGAVLEYLQSKGVESGRLTSKGYGSSMPVADNDTGQGRALNRRVEFAPITR
ncbi:MAG TPA: OmpA family protein, partial [Deltaproteobacteria bacterium]|nr:OmpA family protein [Deltaproteobacteria bacterium]